MSGMGLARFLALLAWVTLGCAADGPVMAPVTPSGPSPILSTSLGFGDSPLEGFVYLRPRSGTKGWRYAVDLDEDGAADHEGVLQGDIGFAYRFTTPGVHHIAADLAGPDGQRTVQAPVIVNDPEAVSTLMERQIVELEPFSRVSFEGITTDHAGSALYVGDFRNNHLYRLDPGNLGDLAPPLQLPTRRGIEGLSIPRSDTLLFIAHKNVGLSVVAIPAMEVRQNLPISTDFFVHAVDDTSALLNGAPGFGLVDVRNGSVLRSVPILRAWHFSVSPVSPVVAVLSYGPPTIHFVNLPDLGEIGRLPLSDLVSVSTVAFDPAGDRLYVMGRDSMGARFVLVDAISRTVLSSLALGRGSCGYCVANPVATLPSGRFVAMEWGGGTYFIDTELDLPRFHTGIRGSGSVAGLSVAASPVEEAFYLLRPDGLVRKVAIRP